jgi:hypothetical protein
LYGFVIEIGGAGSVNGAGGVFSFYICGVHTVVGGLCDICNIGAVWLLPVVVLLLLLTMVNMVMSLVFIILVMNLLLVFV